MAKPKYKITNNDYDTAERWMERKASALSLGNENRELSRQAMKDFEIQIKSSGRLEALNAWAEKYLSTEEWVKMKNAIRAQRKRQSDQRSFQRKISIDISVTASCILREISKRDNVTLSQVIEKYLEPEFMKSIENK
jgi:macrodomain Ter protein organizer (MatP/YcbG family)